MDRERQTSLTVLQPGLLTTVQDLGRFGYSGIGMPTAGVMDAYAARIGNILVGNAENAAVLEITLLGPVLEFHRETDIVISGADMRPCLNQRPVDMGRVLPVTSGDRLSFAGLLEGCRTYLAVAGGFDVPAVMGSASTYVRGQIGGHKGRALQAGDSLMIGRATGHSGRGFRLPADMLTASGATVRVILGPQDNAFTQKGVDTLLGSEYVVAQDSDRMGYRLAGPAIELRDSADIISDGIALGAVQVPAHGQPIIMLADHQTTGGYAKIAHVISVDIPIVAQKKPGDILRFAAVSVQTAQQLYRERERRIARLKDDIQALIQAAHGATMTTYTLSINGRQYHARVEELTQYKKGSL